MRKAIINFAIVGFVLSIFVVSCKKYPEDEYLLTFRSIFSRIKGSKKIEYAYSRVDSTDILNIYEEKFGPFYLYFTDIIEKKEPNEKYYVYIINANTNELICLTVWSIYKEKSSFQLDMNSFYYGPKPCFTDSAYSLLTKIDINGPILKCDKNELVLSHAKFTTYEP
jgi:hypothetical protein